MLEMDPISSFGADSQPSQILREVLRGALDVSNDGPLDEHNSWIDEDSNSATSRAAPQYHYHGLAATQSQSQFDDSHIGQDSQKENTPANAENISMSLLHQSPSLSTKESLVPETVTSPCVPKPTKAVSFASPRVTSPVHPSELRQSRSLHSPASRRRSPSPVSQDSFAGPAFRKDPEQEFLAATKQFTVPLSELGVSPDDSMFTSLSNKTNQTRQNAPVPIPRSQSSNESTSQQSDAVTGFRTSASQPESQQQGQDDTNYDDYIVNNHNREAFIEPDSQYMDFEDSPHPSSCSEGNYPVVTGEEPTQLFGVSAEGEQPTQVSTQPVSSPSMPPVHLSTTDTSTATRGIQSLVGRKKWRLEGIHAPAPLNPVAVSIAEEEATQPTPDHELVAPPHLASLPASKLTPPPITPRKASLPTPSPEGPTRATPAARVTLPPGTAMVHVSKPPQAAAKVIKADDSMDFIPDSEPPRTDLPVSERKPSPPRQPPLPRVAEVDHEIIPDSFEEEESKELSAPPMSPMAVDRALGEFVESPKELEELPEEPDESLEEPEEDEAPIVPHMSGSKTTRRTSGRVRNLAVYTEDSDSDSDSQPLAKVAEKLRKIPSPPPAKKRKLDVPVTPAPRITRSRKAHPMSAPQEVKPKLKKTVVTKSKGKASAKKQSVDSGSTSSRHTSASFGEDAKTEIAMDDEDYVARSFMPDDSGPSKKRKRTGSTMKKVSGSSLKSTAAASTTPSTRSAKQLRSAPGSLKAKGLDPTRVFARWPFSGNYYSGTVHSRFSTRRDRYIIKFDDNTESDVLITELRKCEFVTGDNVYLIGHKRYGEVSSTKLWEQEGKIRVEVEGGVEFDVEPGEVRISFNNITSEWGKRTLTANSIVPFLQAQSLRSSPSKSLLVNGTSSANFLKQVGFVVTLSPRNPNWAEVRDKLIKKIEGRGGTVVSDWSTIFELDAEHSGKRWTAGREHVSYAKGASDIRHVFLLADEANQKPKFLIALALGIPCVSITWLLDSILEDSLLPWAPYLLPAGHCGSFDASASQRINLGWGDKTQEMSDVLANPLASKLLWGKSVLCIGEGMFPPGKSMKRTNSGGDDEKQKEATRTVPRIVLAMGAELVEAVLEPKHASMKLNRFDYVLVKEVDDVEQYAGEGVACVHLPWLKECLIASQLLPLPGE